MNGWQFEENAVIAAFDVLGFKSIMRDWDGVQDTCARVSSLISMIESVADEATRFNVDGIRSSASIKVAQASDTFVIYCPYQSSSDLAQFIWNVQQLLFHSIRVCFPLRGAITVGRVAANPTDHLFLGPAVLKALEYERVAEWSGAIVCPTLEEELRRRNLLDHLAALLVRYSVPFKEELKVKLPSELLCLNWLADGPNYINPNFIEAKFPPYDISTKEGQVVRSKIQNTRRFMEYALKLDCAEGPINRKVVIEPAGDGMNIIKFILDSAG